MGCCYVRDGKNVVPDVCNVLDKIMDFSEKVLSGSSCGASCFLKHLVEYAVLSIADMQVNVGASKNHRRICLQLVLMPVS